MVSYLIINTTPLFGTAALCRYLTKEEKMGLQVRKTYENIKRSELVIAETSNNPHCLWQKSTRILTAATRDNRIKLEHRLWGRHSGKNTRPVFRSQNPQKKPGMTWFLLQVPGWAPADFLQWWMVIWKCKLKSSLSFPQLLLVRLFYLVIVTERKLEDSKRLHGNYVNNPTVSVIVS